MCGTMLSRAGAISTCAISRSHQPAQFSGRASPSTHQPRNRALRRVLPRMSSRARAAYAPGGDSEEWEDGDDYDDEDGEYGADPGPVKRSQRFNFVYANDGAVADMQRALEAAQLQSMEEYAALKALLLRRTWRFGALFAGYLLLAVSAEAAAAELIGAAAGYGYLLGLMRQVDEITPDTPVPLKAAEAVGPAPARAAAKLAAAYQHAISPRLLVPAGLVAACAAWNAAMPEWQVGLVEQGCMLGGFASYKAALVLKIYDDLKPRARTEEEMMQALRPRLAEVEDVQLEIKRPSQLRAEQEAAEAAAGAKEG